MYLKLIGAILIIAGCGGYGILMAMNHRREVKALHQLIYVLQQMICELEYRMPPLPELCRFGGGCTTGAIRSFFLALARMMDEQVSPDVATCTIAALKSVSGIPSQAAAQLQSLGQMLGRFDLSGQLVGLERCAQACQGQLEVMEHQQTQRLRSYQTLGFCAGAALAILLF